MNTSVSDTIAKLVQPAIELDSELSLQEAELLAQLDAVRAERRRLAAILRAADPSRAPVKPGPKPTFGASDGRVAPYSVSETVVEEIRQVVALFQDEFTSRQILEAWDGEGSETARRDKISKSLARLRERGQVRLVSKQRGKHGGHRFVATPNIRVAFPDNGSGS